MNYYHLPAYHELGDAKGAAEQRQRLQAAIAARECPETINAYAKFGGENTPNERVRSRTAEAAYLKGLAALADNLSQEASNRFEEAIELHPALIWAKRLRPQ